MKCPICETNGLVDGKHTEFVGEVKCNNCHQPVKINAPATFMGFRGMGGVLKHLYKLDKPVNCENCKQQLAEIYLPCLQSVAINGKQMAKKPAIQVQ